MSNRITVPFSKLILSHRDIGIHRGRKYGLRDVFRFYTLRDVHFLELANKVKDAFEGRDVPSHKGWPAQHKDIEWFVDQGKEELLKLSDRKGEVKVRPGRNDRFYILDGNHRCLALYILGDNEVQVKVKRDW